MKRLLCVCALALLGLSACAGGFLDASQIEALAKDQASVCFSATHPYGNLKFARTNCTNCNVVCDADGLKVQTDAAKVGVPVTIVTTITLGPPTVTPR